MPARPAVSPEQRARLAAYDRLVATLPAAERKGVSLPYTSVNGNMSSYLDAAGTLALRLGASDRDAFMTRYDAALQVAHGAVQREYVAVPRSLLDNTAELTPWFAASHAYVAGLTPKPSRRNQTDPSKRPG